MSDWARIETGNKGNFVVDVYYGPLDKDDY